MPMICASAAFPIPEDYSEFHSNFIKVDPTRPEERYFTGREQGIVAQTYFSDDDATFDHDDTDAAAFADWRQLEVEEDRDIRMHPFA